MDSDAPNDRTPWLRRTATFMRPEGVWFTTFSPVSVIPDLLEPTVQEFDDFSRDSLVELADTLRGLGMSGLVWALLARFPHDRRGAWARAMQEIGYLKIEAHYLPNDNVGLRFRAELDTPTNAAPTEIDPAAAAPTLLLHVSPDGSDLLREWDAAKAQVMERSRQSSPYSYPPYDIDEATRKSIIARFVERMPLAVWIPPEATSLPDEESIREFCTDAGRAGSEVERLVATQGGPPAVDGHYYCEVLEDAATGGRGFLVSYLRRGNAPQFAECLAAGRHLLPAAFDHPLATGLHPPLFARDIVVLAGTSPSGLDALAAGEMFGESLEQAVVPGAAERARALVIRDGIEAFAWYQPFHYYDDESWGIYMLSPPLADIAVALWETLTPKTPRRLGLAMWIVVRLVWRHEMWHASMEVLSLREELTSRGAFFRRYHRQVYRKTLRKGLNREEAAANYVAHEGLLLDLAHLEGLNLLSEDDAKLVRRFVEEMYEMSPPGYRDWRLASDPLFWRALASELFTGVPGGNGTPAPLEHLLRQAPGTFSEDVQVPTRVVGGGLLADILFATPSLREVERVLRSRGYNEHPDRGKGSHVVWVAPDGTSIFPLPRRDPLSVTVFATLLRHLNLTKREYMEVRQEV